MEGKGKKQKVWFEGQLVEVEDVTPTWESVLPVLIETIHASSSRSQLYSMARNADKYKALLEFQQQLMDDTIESFEKLIALVKEPGRLTENQMVKLKGIENEIAAYRHQRLLEKQGKGES